MAKRLVTKIVEIYECVCERKGCRFEAVELPRACPKCKSRYWDVPRGTRKIGRPKKPKP